MTCKWLVHGYVWVVVVEYARVIWVEYVWVVWGDHVWVIWGGYDLGTRVGSWPAEENEETNHYGAEYQGSPY